MKEHKDEYTAAKKEATMDADGEKGRAWKKTMKQAFGILQLRRDKRALREHDAARKTGPAASADIRTTMDTVSQSINTLPERAGFAVFALGCRTDHGQGTDPIAIVPPILEDFFQAKLGMSAIRVAQKAEAFLLGGGADGAGTRERNAHDNKKAVAERLRISFGMFSFLFRQPLISIYRNSFPLFQPDQL